MFDFHQLQVTCQDVQAQKIKKDELFYIVIVVGVRREFLVF
jgi:hypothetical protein